MDSIKRRVIGIVPARSGSKGLPGKNIRLLAGKHLLGWAVEGGLKSGALDVVYVMTDSAEYAEIGKQYGAEAPLLLAPEVATDTAHVFHALKWYLLRLKELGEKPDYVVLLEPTAPGRQGSHIQQLVELTIANGSDAGITLMEVPTTFNSHWQISLDENGNAMLAMGGPVNSIMRQRQSLPKRYVRGGSTYVCKTECLLKDQPDMYGDTVSGLVIDGKYAVDLDTDEDWKEAETIIGDLHRETK